MKLTYKSFEHRTKILDPFYRDPGLVCGKVKKFSQSERKQVVSACRIY